MVIKLTKSQKARKLTSYELKTYLQFSPRDKTLMKEAKRRKKK